MFGWPFIYLHRDPPFYEALFTTAAILRKTLRNLRAITVHRLLRWRACVIHKTLYQLF